MQMIGKHTQFKNNSCKKEVKEKTHMPMVEAVVAEEGGQKDIGS